MTHHYAELLPRTCWSLWHQVVWNNLRWDLSRREMGIDMIDGLMREFDRNVACVVEDIMIRTDSMFWCCCFFKGSSDILELALLLKGSTIFWNFMRPLKFKMPIFRVKWPVIIGDVRLSDLMGWGLSDVTVSVVQLRCLLHNFNALDIPWTCLVYIYIYIVKTSAKRKLYFGWHLYIELLCVSCVLLLWALQVP